MSYFYGQKSAQKEANRKIQEVDFVLRFGILSVLDTQNIAFFAEKTGVKIVIKRGEEIISSSGKENVLDWRESPVLKDGFLHRGFEYSGIYYVLSCKLRQDFFQPFLFATLILCVYVVFWIFYLGFQEQLRYFLVFRSEKSLIGSSLFKEVNLLERQFERVRQIVFKKELKNSKQAKKIRLKNAQLLSLISAISHEIKNPLSVISLALESLEHSNLQSKSKFIDKIRHQVHKLNNITQKLNFVFNLRSDSLQLEAFDLLVLVQEITEGYKEPRLRVVGEESYVSADIFLIEQVVVNLISNALKYSQKEVLLEVRGGEFKITDYGIGIPQSEYKKITKKFYKIHHKRENSFGLGLFIVKKILNLHKSSLRIESIPKQRTTFSFSLTSNPKALSLLEP